MAHLALYRQYRPTTFDKVIGQEHITTILLHQIEQKQPSHAYLFCGSRGTGKTTTAKILARAINCLSPVGGEPCGQCENCRAALKENGDIIEIDAASNTGVDDVREVIEQAQYLPFQLTHRVFIIDEVHMLSVNAFNALLKTLEEPPAHVVFILATTEPQKLPATIISRCQRFDFRRLNMAHILTCLKGVLNSVGATMELEGMQLIARAADGGMRDALSLADQCLSFCGKTITAEDVYNVLGSVDQDVLFRLADAILKGDCKETLDCVNSVVVNGRSLAVFTNDLSAHFRALLLTKTCGDCTDILDCTPDKTARYQKQAKGYDESKILYAMEQLIKAQSALRYFPAPRTLVETTLIRICRPVDDNDVAALVERIAALEKMPHRVEPMPKQADVRPSEPIQAPTQPLKQTNEPLKQTNEPPHKTEVKQVQPSPVLDDAAVLWQAVKSEIQRRNGMLYMSLSNATATSLKGDTLTVEFPVGSESKYNICKAPVNFRIAQDVLLEMRPECGLIFIVETPSSEVSKLQELFGDKLTVE